LGRHCRQHCYRAGARGSNAETRDVCGVIQRPEPHPPTRVKAPRRTEKHHRVDSAAAEGIVYYTAPRAITRWADGLEQARCVAHLDRAVTAACRLEDLSSGLKGNGTPCQWQLARCSWFFFLENSRRIVLSFESHMQLLF
jgi:hypothetical protein